MYNISVIRIIDNDPELKNQYHNSWYSAEDIKLTKEQLQALFDGKCLIWNDGEYSHSISME